jgi:hypothetical protein
MPSDATQNGVPAKLIAPDGGPRRACFMLCCERNRKSIAAMNKPNRPTIEEIEAAARVLDREGRFYNWWPSDTKSYDQLGATDPLGKSEFDGIVERILTAAFRARFG